MAKIALVTDSTAYIPKELCEKFNITIVPQVVIWGDETLEDGVDILPDAFYQRLATAKVMPTTSQASIINMKKAFGKLIGEGYEVLGVFLSSKLSGTLQSATHGREELESGKEKVEIMDSETTAMALGFQVLSAARAALDGASIMDCKALVERTRPNTGIYFAVDTLEFLHRGGRIGGAQRFLGTALNLKPILTVQHGRVEPIDRVRTKSKAHERVIDLVAERCAGKTNIRLATFHANAHADAKALIETASARLKPIETVMSELSPAVGTHTGPGTVGLAYAFE